MQFFTITTLIPKSSWINHHCEITSQGYTQNDFFLFQKNLTLITLWEIQRIKEKTTSPNSALQPYPHPVTFFPLFFSFLSSCFCIVEIKMVILFKSHIYMFDVRKEEQFDF